MTEIRDTERNAWRAYAAYCLNWRNHRNRREQGIFCGDDRSRELGAIWLAARRLLPTLSQSRRPSNRAGKWDN